MKRTVKIWLDPEGADEWKIRYFRNLDSEVYRECSHLAEVDLGEADHGALHFHLRNVRRQDRGAVSQILDRLIVKHGLMGYAFHTWE